MITELVKKGGQTKIIKLEHNGRTVQVALGLVNTSRKGAIVQANYLITQDGTLIKGWKKHGSIRELVQKHLDYEVYGTRQDFIDKIYYSC